MRIAIAGGHGSVALHATRRLTDAGVEVTSLIRDPDQADDIREVGATPVVADLEASTGEELAAVVGSVDAVIFAAGAGPGSGAARKESVDHQGAVKFLEVARLGGARHYVMLSSMGADPEHEGDEVFDHYLRAKGRADRDVIESDVGSTIVRPTRLTDDPAAGVVELTPGADGDPISREDVGDVLARLALLDATGATVQLTAGPTPVAEAVASLSSAG